MSRLKLFGFTAKELRSLSSKVGTGVWEAVNTGQIDALPSADEIWIVSVTAIDKFLNPILSSSTHNLYSEEVSQQPKALLWVPQGKNPLPFDVWWDRFHAQLREDNVGDEAFLKKISRCVRVLEWGELVEDMPANWFAGLTGSPLQVPIDGLSFNEGEKLHLKECEDCREEAYACLQQGAEMRWEMLCPSANEVAAWLSADEDTSLTEHVRNCALCRESIYRQAGLWGGAGLITREQVNSKLVTIGFPNINAEWELRRLREAKALEWAVKFVLSLRKITRRRGRGQDRLQDLLKEGRPFKVLSDGDWWQLTVKGEVVLIEAGKSENDRLDTFIAVLRHDAKEIVSVKAIDGFAELTLEDIQKANQEEANQLVIIV